MSAVQIALKTELTSIPRSLHELFGDNFNNAMCNGVAWFVILWCVVHSCFEKILDVYLKHQGFPQYARNRLTDSLWLQICAIFYMTYSKNVGHTEDWMNFKLKNPDLEAALPNHVIVAQAALCSFYFHMSYSEGIRKSSLNSFFKYVLLTVACSTAYILRLLDLPFKLTFLLACVAIVEEFCKVLYSILDKRNKMHNIFIWICFALSILANIFVYVIIIPVYILLTLGIHIFYENPSLLGVMLFLSLFLWYSLANDKSTLLNLLIHKFDHEKLIQKMDGDKSQQPKRIGCYNNTVECSLFPPRTDDSYMLACYRSEAKERQRRLIAKRKPKNQNMIVQTLKCMMAIKRKLNEKRSQNLDEANSEDSEPKITFPEEEEEEDRKLEPLKRSSKALTVVEELVLTQSSNVIDIDDEDDENELHSKSESELKNVLVEEGDDQHEDVLASEERDVEIVELDEEVEDETVKLLAAEREDHISVRGENGKFKEKTDEEDSKTD